MSFLGSGGPCRFWRTEGALLQTITFMLGTGVGSLGGQAVVRDASIDVTLRFVTVVPEPGTCALKMAGLGAVLLLARWLARQRQALPASLTSPDGNRSTTSL